MHIDHLFTTHLESQKVECASRLFLKTGPYETLRSSAPLASAVIAHISDPAVPSFREYQGGDLQAAFIEQWRAANAIESKWSIVVKAADAVYNGMAAGEKTLAGGISR